MPSYKFIPLTYQISSRVGSAGDKRFRACVERLILRLCLEHPHHSLLQLLALANGENVSGGGATQARIVWSFVFLVSVFCRFFLAFLFFVFGQVLFCHRKTGGSGGWERGRRREVKEI